VYDGKAIGTTVRGRFRHTARSWHWQPRARIPGVSRSTTLPYSTSI